MFSISIVSEEKDCSGAYFDDRTAIFGNSTIISLFKISLECELLSLKLFMENGNEVPAFI